MTKYTLPLALLGLLLFAPSCHHHAKKAPAPHYSHEEAEPVSNLPHHEFSQVSPASRSHKKR